METVGKPKSSSPEPQTLNPKPKTPKSKPEALNPEPEQTRLLRKLKGKHLEKLIGTLLGGTGFLGVL